jgi:hypothetical protein
VRGSGAVQEAHNTAGTEDEASFRRGRSWLATAVLVLVAAVGVIAATIIFTMDSGAPDAPPTRSDSNAGAPTLTDQEAIDRYLELEDLIVQAYRNADIEVLQQIYTADSSTKGVVRDELRDLRRESVRAILQYETEEITVLSQSAEEVTLQQQVLARHRVRPVGDVKVQATRNDHRRVVRIVLRNEGGQWLIHRSTITDVEELTE